MPANGGAPSRPGTPRPTGIFFRAGAFASCSLNRSTDGDGLCDDVNGNFRADFADVVLYFNQMSWIGVNEPVAAFDCNGNGRIDFADVVWLFNHI